MSKYYAVAKGRQIGIFRNWDETKNQVDKYPGARYKSFLTQKEAEEYIKGIDNNTNYSSPQATPKRIEPNDLIIYTDGSCVNYQGGIGILYLYEGQIINTISLPIIGETTNIRAELTAIKVGIEGIPEHLKDKQIVIRTDSEYSINALTKWMNNWSKNGWKTTTGEPVKNLDLLLSISRILYNIKFEWVKGHSSDIYNQKVDELANQGRLSLKK